MLCLYTSFWNLGCLKGFRFSEQQCPSHTKGLMCFQRLTTQLLMLGWPHRVEGAPSSLFCSPFRTLPVRHLFLRDSCLSHVQFGGIFCCGLNCTACPRPWRTGFWPHSPPTQTLNSRIQPLNNILEASSSTNNPWNFASPTSQASQPFQHLPSLHLSRR